MKKKKPENERSSRDAIRPYKVRLPGFISGEVGLGEVIRRATSAAGIKTCGGCARRAAVLNRWLVFTGGRSR